MTTTTHPSALERALRSVPPERELRRLVGAGFDVVLYEGQGRSVRVVPGADRLAVVVAEAGEGLPMAADLPVPLPASGMTVWAHADGTVSVRAAFVPPALHVRGDGVTMVPEVPGAPGTTVLAAGDRLVALSSSAYEAAPEALVRLMRADAAPARGGTDCLHTADPAALLRKLLRDAPGAGGVVITRLPALHPAHPVGGARPARPDHRPDTRPDTHRHPHEEEQR